MRQNSRKKTDKQKNKERLRRRFGEQVERLGEAVEEVIKGVSERKSGNLKIDLDRYKKECAQLQEKILKQLDQIDEVSDEMMTSLSDAECPYSEEDMIRISGKGKQRAGDAVIWKTYSKRGGIYDTLLEIVNSTEHPPANAFDFDEEEGCYIIFMILNNTYLKRFRALYGEMSDAYRENCESAEVLGLEDKKRELQKQKDDLSCLAEELSGKHSYRKELQKIDENKGWAGKASALGELSRKLDRCLEKAEKCSSDVQMYEERLNMFKEECRALDSYSQKYAGLLEALERIYGMESEALGVITCSPAREEGLDNYMEAAHKFCEEVSCMMKEYPL